MSNNKLEEIYEDTKFSPLLIGVSGGSASGKTTICEHIKLNLEKCTILGLDNYYRGIPDPKMAKDYNFDDPNSLDFDLMYNHVVQLMNWKSIDAPNYCFKLHKRLETTTKVNPSDIIFFEGIFALHDKRIRDLMTFKIFVTCDDDVRLSRRMLRDIKERGRDTEGVLYQYHRFVKPSFNEFVKPTINYADIIIPGGRQNLVSIKFVVQNLKSTLQGIQKIKKQLKNTLVYHGDQVEDFWLIPQIQGNILKNPAMIEVYLRKQLIFENDMFYKKQFEYIFEQLKFKFEFKFLSQCVRKMTKHLLQMFKKQLNDQGLSFLDVNFNSDNNDQLINFLFVPWVYNQNSQKYVDKIQEMLQNASKKPIYILNILSSTFNLIKFVSLSSNIKLINIACISSEKKLQNCINENCINQKDFYLQELNKDYQKTFVKFFRKNFIQNSLLLLI